MGAGAGPEGAGGGGGGGGEEEPTFERDDGYLSELLSYSLERLNKEPELLREDRDRIQRQMQTVAVGQYTAFIETASCMRKVREEVSQVQGYLGELERVAPGLAAACEDFSLAASDIAVKREQNKHLQENLSTLLELLEVPGLMDTCVRNESYDEALDLEAFVNKMGLLHSELDVVQMLVKDVQQTSARMLEKLLVRLQGPIQLPECLRIVGYLRRMANFSEVELRMNFMTCRDLWLERTIADLDRASPYEFVKRLTDVHRVQMFDIIMQYRAIFSDDKAAGAAGGLESGVGVLFDWVCVRVGAYLDEVRANMPKIAEGANISNVLEHCMYCGVSLGRVGCDFRGLLVPIFEECIYNVWLRTTQNALDIFKLMLGAHKWAANYAARASATTGSGNMPPFSLLDHAPLAVLVNGILAAFNEVRHCAALSLEHRLSARLDAVLQEVSEAIVSYHETSHLEAKEREKFEEFCQAYTGTAVPYLLASFAKLYGVKASAAGTGAGVSAPIAALLARDRAGAAQA